jgi:hypothetical protein
MKQGKPVMDKEALAARMRLAQFPRSARYDIEWLCENEMGPCSTWLAEYLFETMEVKKGARILDLGCGMAMSSIFIAREYDVWLHWDRTLKEAGVLRRCGDVEMLELDGGNFTWTRVVGRKK